MSLLRTIRRLTNHPRPEDLSGPAADNLVHRLSFDFHGGKWMYMRVPPETSVPVNELPYVPDQPEPPILAGLERRPIILPDIEHGKKHHADLFKDAWRWKVWGPNGVHGSLFIWIYAGFNTKPELNERDEQQTRAVLQRQWDDWQKHYRAIVVRFRAKPWRPPICTDLAQHVREELHVFRGLRKQQRSM